MLTASIGLIPELSARIKGIYSKASAKHQIAYYSTVGFLSAIFQSSIAEFNSTAPPPTTT